VKSNCYLYHVYPSVCLHGKIWIPPDYHEILYLNIFKKSVEKIQVSLKFEKYNGYFTRRHVYIYDADFFFEWGMFETKL